MYKIPRKKVRKIPRRKSKRLSQRDTNLQALEQAGSPTAKTVDVRRETLEVERPERSNGERLIGKGKGKMDTPVVSRVEFRPGNQWSNAQPFTPQESYRTLRPFTRFSPKSRPSRPHLRAFLDPSSPVYESPYHLRRQAHANNPSSLSRSGETSAVFDSSSPLLDRRRPAPAQTSTPRLDIANPMYTLRPREGDTRGQSEWITKRMRMGKPLMDSGL